MRAMEKPFLVFRVELAFETSFVKFTLLSTKLFAVLYKVSIQL